MNNRLLTPYGILAVCLLCAASPVHAQDAATAEPSAAATGQDEAGKTGDRIFGMLPNHTTVEGAKVILPVSTKQMFRMAEQDAFDKPVFPFVVFTTWVAQIQGDEASWGKGPAGFAKRYATTFSDDVVATFLTTAIMPTLLHQDPRYFELGEGGAWHRATYAATRSFVTRSPSGHTQFNYSDVAGNAIAAGLSNFYHPAEDRSWSATATRWGTQMMWDVLSDELKEFWPDIRRRIHKQ